VAIKFGLPREAVRSERPSGDGASAGGAGSYSKRGRQCGGMRWGGRCWAIGSQSWGDLPPPGEYHEVRPPSIFDEFLDFRKSPLVRNGGSPKTSGVEIWVKIWDFLPPFKK